MFNLKSFLLICLLVITGGINHRVSAADITYKQLGAGDVIKTDGTKYAIQLYDVTQGNTLSKQNYFLANGGTKSSSIPVITLGATNTSYITNISNIISDVEGAGKAYLFTFEVRSSDGKIVVKNYNDGTYWVGDLIQQVVDALPLLPIYQMPRSLLMSIKQDISMANRLLS